MGIQIGDTLYRKGRKPEERSAGECFDVPKFRSDRGKTCSRGGIKPKPRW